MATRDTSKKQYIKSYDDYSTDESILFVIKLNDINIDIEKIVDDLLLENLAPDVTSSGKFH